MSKGTFCPLLKKDCIQHKCVWFGNIRGTNPNTGQELDEWNCAINFLPSLLIENSQKQAQTGAAVESFRNESIKQNSFNAQMLNKALVEVALMGQVSEAEVKLLS